MKLPGNRLTNILVLIPVIGLPVVLGACSGSSTPPSPPQPPAIPEVTLASDVQVSEGDSGTGTMTFTIELSTAADAPVTIEYATDNGTAIASTPVAPGDDYIAGAGSVVIPPAQTSQTINVTINGDIQFETDETFTLTIGSVSSNATLGSATTRTGTITNNDPVPLLLFIADRETDGVNELWLYSVETGTAAKVNQTLVAGGNVTSFAMSPDRKWIAYVADQEIDERFELYIRDVSLSNPAIKGSAPFPIPGTDVSDNPVWAPDSSRVAYRSDQELDERFDLMTVIPSGVTHGFIVPPGLNKSADVVQDSYVWSPDSSRIAFLADVITPNRFELYSSTPKGTSRLRINPVLGAGQVITDHAWAPDSSAIAYRANQGANNEYELYVADPETEGSGTAVGGTSGTTNANVEAGSLSWAPDGSRIAFIADIDTDEVFDLYTVLPNGSDRIRVSNAITGQSDVTGAPTWAPDSSRIAYIGDLISNDVFELFTSEPAVADTSTPVSGALSSGNVETGLNSQTAPPAWSPDSTSLIYVADQGAGVKEVFVAPADGSGSASGNTKVSGSLVAGASPSLSGDKESWSPEGVLILYRADQDMVGTFSLWTSTSGGTGNTLLTSATPALPGALKNYGKWSPDRSFVAYASEQDTAGVVELFIADPSGTITNVSGTMVTGGNVDADSFVWAP